MCGVKRGAIVAVADALTYLVRDQVGYLVPQRRRAMHAVAQYHIKLLSRWAAGELFELIKALSSETVRLHDTVFVDVWWVGE